MRLRDAVVWEDRSAHAWRGLCDDKQMTHEVLGCEKLPGGIRWPDIEHMRRWKLRQVHSLFRGGSRRLSLYINATGGDLILGCSFPQPGQPLR